MRRRKFTERGFEDFVEFIDAYGNLVIVRESSSVGDPAVWVFCKQGGRGVDQSPSPLLTAEQAQLLVNGLRAFIGQTHPGMLRRFCFSSASFLVLH